MLWPEVTVDILISGIDEFKFPLRLPDELWELLRMNILNKI